MDFGTPGGGWMCLSVSGECHSTNICGPSVTGNSGNTSKTKETVQKRKRYYFSAVQTTFLEAQLKDNKHQQEAGVGGGGHGWGRGGVGTYSKTPDRGGVGGGGFLRGDLKFRHSRGGLDLEGGYKHMLLVYRILLRRTDSYLFSVSSHLEYPHRNGSE